MARKLRCGEGFHRAFSELDLHSRTILLNKEFVLREANDGLRLVESLHSYQDFLSNARQHKSRSGRLSVTFEHEVLNQARQAREDLRTLSAKALRVIKHLNNAGILDDALKTWKDGVKAAGQVRLQDVWADVLDVKGARGIFEQAGISQTTIEALTEAIGEFEQVHKVEQDKIIIQTSRHDRKVIISRRPTFAQMRSVDQLLFGKQFDAATEAFHQPGAVFADVIPNNKAHAGKVDVMDPLEALLAGATLSVQELHRQVRELEDTGLATYQGNMPVLIVILVVIALVAATAVVAGGTILILCDNEVITDDTVCDAGIILLIFGLVIFVGLVDCLIEGCELIFKLLFEGKEAEVARTEVEGGI